MKFYTFAFAALLFAGCSQPKKQESPQQKSDSTSISQADPLPSWNEGASKKAIIDFVTRTTTKGSADFVTAEQRIACFDNDGTLWSEQPLYYQFLFGLDRIKALSVQHPEWKKQQPFKSILEGDLKTALSGGRKSLDAILTATNNGITTSQYDSMAAVWLATAKHPRFDRLYTDLVYEPMIELLNYLRANGYKTYIVSGGVVDFMRVYSQQAYGIPPDQVVGTTIKLKYEVKDDKPQLTRVPEIDFVDNGPGKPVGIYNSIGERPVFTAGNSDGDYEMLQYTSTTTAPHFCMLVHHTDSLREWKYDRNSAIGQLDKGLDDAPKNGWLVVDMKNDWNVIYPFEKK
jgi:phosphoglycolate phosphatase-like HAD superfamily hydrolase